MANTRSARIWHMKKVKEQLGKEVCRNLLFLQANTGCDTTLHLYGVGKAAVLKKFEKVLSFKEQANVLSSHSAVSDVVTAGEKALVSLFRGENLASKTPHIEPQNLHCIWHM